MPITHPTAKTIFLDALEIASAEARQAYLAVHCASDDRLRGEVQELLRHHEQIAPFPDSASLAETAPPGIEQLGMSIGPYKLLEQIGEGGMGIVYMAEQTQPVKRKVALKIIKPGMDTRQVIARFEAERQALALMDHPNIARILDAGTLGGNPKLEARNTKQIESTKSKAQNAGKEPAADVSNFGPSDLDFVSDFEIRTTTVRL